MYIDGGIYVRSLEGATSGGLDWAAIWIGAAASLMLAVVAGLVWRLVRPMAERTRAFTYLRSRYLRRSVQQVLKITTTDLASEVVHIGARFEFPWATIAFGPYTSADIDARFDPSSRPYWDEVVQWHRELEAKNATAAASPIYNSPGLRLTSFTSTRHPPDERPGLSLSFCATDYFFNLASDQRLDVKFADTDGTVTTLREKYCSGRNLHHAPYSGSATHFGVQLAVVTADGILVIPTRGATATAPSTISPSVGEGALPSTDIGAAGEYLPTLTARRGMREELGVTVDSEVTWISFGANPITGQYALVGLVRVDLSFDDIRQLVQIGIAKDQWENSRIDGIEFTPEGFAQYMTAATAQWSPFALIAFVHALIISFGWRRVARALGPVQVRVQR